MRRFALLALGVVLAGCGSSRTPTAPEVEDPFPYRAYSGLRSLSVVEGADTCLGQLLAAQEPRPASLEIPHRPDPGFLGDLHVDGDAELCIVRGEVADPKLSFFDYRCTPNCWWESFECDGRAWSFCRQIGDSRFDGSIGEDRVAGVQRVRFNATNGASSYDVVVDFDYRLDRMR